MLQLLKYYGFIMSLCRFLLGHLCIFMARMLNGVTGTSYFPEMLNCSNCIFFYWLKKDVSINNVRCNKKTSVSVQGL